MKTFLKDWNKSLRFAFSALFLFSFSMILLNVIFNKTVYNYNTFLLIFFMALFLGGLVAVSVWLLKKKAFFDKYYKETVVIAVTFLFCIQIVLGIFLQFDPTWDLEAIYQGAIAWVEHGTFTQYHSNTCHGDYFYIFPNNLGSMAFLAFFFKIANLFGIHAYFTVASIVNAGMVVLAMVFAQAVCKRLYGTMCGVFVMLLFLCSLPFYFMGPVFYTDALSLMFPLAAFYGLLKAEDASKPGQKIGWYIFTAVMCFVGAMIKMTVLIFVIAAVLYFLLKKRWRELVAFVCISITVIGLGFFSFNSYMYSTYLDKAKADQTNMPAYYWLDLAVHGQGRYDNNIFWDARNESDPELRKELLIQDITQEVKERGARGMYELFERKSARAFGDGTYALSEFLDDRPVKQDQFLHKILLYDGEYYGEYSTITTAIFLIVQILMLVSVCFKKTDFKLLIPQLCVFGVMLFLLCWEVNSRYIMTIIPCILVCAAKGLSKLAELAGERFETAESPSK